MVNNKLLWGKPELSLNEAAELIGCDVDDLIYKASVGDLTLHVLAEEWNAKYISQIDHSKEYSGISVTMTGPSPPQIPDSKNPEEFERQYQAWTQGHDCQDMTIGNITFYGIHGVNRAYYELLSPMSGYQPITVSTFAKYRDLPASATVEISINRMLAISDDAIERFFHPDPDVLVQDALKDGKLFVMKTDLLKILSGESVDPDDAKPDGAVSRKTLLKLVIAMATNNNYKYNPMVKRNDGIGIIEKHLQGCGIGLDQDTIRKALREASALLPAKPHQS